MILTCWVDTMIYIDSPAQLQKLEIKEGVLVKRRLTVKVWSGLLLQIGMCQMVRVLYNLTLCSIFFKHLHLPPKQAKPSEEHVLTAMFDSEECVVCLTETPNTLLIPCKHKCMCLGCATILKETSQMAMCKCMYTRIHQTGPVCRELVASVKLLE